MSQMFKDQVRDAAEILCEELPVLTKLAADRGDKNAQAQLDELYAKPEWVSKMGPYLKSVKDPTDTQKTPENLSNAEKDRVRTRLLSRLRSFVNSAPKMHRRASHAMMNYMQSRTSMREDFVQEFRIKALALVDALIANENDESLDIDPDDSYSDYEESDAEDKYPDLRYFGNSPPLILGRRPWIKNLEAEVMDNQGGVPFG